MIRTRQAILVAVLLLAGCQFGETGRDAPAMGSAAAEITVTTLDPQPASGGSVVADATEPLKAAATGELVEAVGTTVDEAKGAGEGEPSPFAAASPDAPAVEAKTPLQIACERRGGRWATAGKAGSKACVNPTRDGGQQCTRETDCDGLCLARSGSCAPVKPMFGCNDILQADGRRVTLCID